MTFSIAIALASMIFGGTNTAFALWKHFSTTSKYESLKKVLSSYKSTSKYKNEGINIKLDQTHYERKLLESLTVGEVILAKIREKVIGYAIVVVAYVVLTSIFTGFDFKDYNVSGTFKEIEFFDLIIFLTYLLPTLIFKSNLIINKKEKKFLKSFNNLNKRFYDMYVVKSIENFNRDYDAFFKDSSENENTPTPLLTERVDNVRQEYDRNKPVKDDKNVQDEDVVKG